MPFRTSLVSVAAGALALCFAQGVSATHGSVSGSIKFNLSGTFECTADPGELLSVFHNESSPEYIEFMTAQGKTITCTKNDGVNPPITGEFNGSFRTTGPLAISCSVPPTTAAGTSKQTITSSCPDGDVQGTLTAVSGGFTPGDVYNIGGADEDNFACPAVFPAAGLPESVILQTVRVFSNESCGAGEFSAGDLMAAVGGGSVQWRQFSGPPDELTGSNLKRTLTPLTPPCNGGGFTTGMAFDSANNLYVTMFSLGQVCRFDKFGTEISLGFGGPYSLSPESIVFNAAGHAYVGKADGDANIHEVDANGGAVATFDVAIESRGSDWIDLACDQTTMLYTSEGFKIKAFDVATGTQLGDFYSGVTRPLFALRIIPSGPLAGQVLVANMVDVKRISADGTQVLATYDAPSEDDWFSLDLDANGIHFWAAGSASGKAYKFEIAGAGAHLPVQTIDTGAFNLLFGLRVKHGLNCGTQPLPDQTVLDGTLLMRPCGGDDVNVPGNCVHAGVPVTNDVTVFQQLVGIPADSDPNDINIRLNKNTEGIWVAILKNDYAPIADIVPGSLKVMGVAPDLRRGGQLQCQFDPAVWLRCRFNKNAVVEALVAKYGATIPSGITVPMEVKFTSDPGGNFETSALVNLTP